MEYGRASGCLVFLDSKWQLFLVASVTVQFACRCEAQVARLSVAGLWKGNFYRAFGENVALGERFFWREEEGTEGNERE